MTGRRRVRDWQKTDPHIRRHPTFLRFKHRLGVSSIEAHGILAGLFAFAFDFAHDGNLSRFTPEDIAMGIDYEGDPKALWDALSGDVRGHDSDGFVRGGYIHDWHDWGGALFAERTVEAQKKWDRRNAEKAPLQVKVSGGHNRTIQDNAPEERREENKDQEHSSGLHPAAPSKRVIWDNFLVWWSAYGKVGSRADAAVLYNHWVKKGAAPEDLLLAAQNYHEHCLAKDSFQAHGRTFLAKKPNRWKEWVKPEKPPSGNGHGPAPDGKKWVQSYDIAKPAGERYIWRLVDA